MGAEAGLFANLFYYNLVSWIVLLVIAVILAGAGAVFVWKSKDKKTEE